jgi:hypothetical protein
MNRLLALFGSVLLFSVAPSGLSAQSGTDRGPAGPTIQAARAGITAPSAATSVANDAQVETPSRESAALMIVGGAALLAGLVIGGGAGTAIAVGGALLGLYGLWMYVR